MGCFRKRVAYRMAEALGLRQRRGTDRLVGELVPA